MTEIFNYDLQLRSSIMIFNYAGDLEAEWRAVDV